MEVNNQLKEYLYSIYDKNDIVDILHKNSLFGLIGDQFVNFDDNEYCYSYCAVILSGLSPSKTE